MHLFKISLVLCASVASAGPEPALHDVHEPLEIATVSDLLIERGADFEEETPCYGRFCQGSFVVFNS